MVDPGPEAVTESPPWRAMHPHTRRLQCRGLSAAGSDRLLPSRLAKVWIMLRRTFEGSSLSLPTAFKPPD